MKVRQKLSPLSVALCLSVALGITAMAIMLGSGDQDSLMETLRSLSVQLMAFKAEDPWLLAGLFFLAYTCAAALCIPLEIPFALLAGALFGFAGGVVISSFASTIGATLAFLGARHLLRAQIQQRFPKGYEAVNDGVDKDGAFYLINLRLLPILPFSVTNIIMGLTTMKTATFYIVSQVSMIFATLVFVHAGTQLFAVQSYRDLLSPSLMASLAALALLPWLGKGLVALTRAARARPLRAGA